MENVDNFDFHYNILQAMFKNEIIIKIVVFLTY